MGLISITVIFSLLLLSPARALPVQENIECGQQCAGRLAADWPRKATLEVMGIVSAVSVHRPTGDLFVLGRGDRVWGPGTYSGDDIVNRTLIDKDTIFRLNAATGEILDRFGSNLLSMPHGITATDDGFLWITDAGLHQVLKLDLKGNVVLALGDAFSRSEFCKPTQVAVGKDGLVYIADGYCHKRVAVYDPSTGGIHTLFRTSSPYYHLLVKQIFDFRIVHAIAISPLDGHLYVADRQNGRVIVLRKDGSLVKIFKKKYGRTYGLGFGADGSFYVSSDKRLHRVSSSTGEIEWTTGEYTAGHTLAVDERCGAVYVARTVGPEEKNGLELYRVSPSSREPCPNA